MPILFVDGEEVVLYRFGGGVCYNEQSARRQGKGPSMDMRTVIRGVDDAGDLRSFAEEKLAGAVDRFQDSILDATMRLEDVTGPDKGGVDKLCSIAVRLRTGEVRIKEQGDDFRATINIAVDRLKAALSREIAKAKRGIGEG